ncbi:hypothetical protein [Endozoicomonas acroporae]|uniref:hypothetical protein n=1 Tax=Endozoicomonas acroporae TaxID=1701104 RepID=UPI003D7AD4FF
MIRQSGVNPADMAIDPQPVTTPTTEPGRWRGWEVIQTGASAFIRSLHPLYDPLNSDRHLPVQDVADSAAGIDLWGVVGQNNNFHQFTALAGRAIAVYSGLPPEINSLLSYLANLAAVGRFASDQLNAFNACGGSIPEPGTHREKTQDETLENTKGKTRKASQNLRHWYDKSAAPTLPASQLPNAPLALGALVGLSAVGASSASASDPWIDVKDPKDLDKICHHDAGSCSKQYRLIGDIDGSKLSWSIGDKDNPFTGKLDGNYRTIGKLSKCLVKHLSAEGRIENLTLSDAKIISTDPAGVVACEMSDNAKISNIRVERADVTTMDKLDAYAAIMDKSDAYAAIGVGKVDGGGTITNMNALDCTVETSGKSVSAGIGAGSLISGAVNNMVAVNCNVTTKGEAGIAGIGAGFSKEGIVNHTTAVNCRVETTERGAYAGIGVGAQSKGNVTDTTALNCTVITKGFSAYAGIGAGSSENEGTVNHTTAVNCHVVTEGGFATAGIGIGSFGSEWSGKEIIANTKAFNSNVTSEKAYASISGGDKSFICNVTVGDKLEGTDKGCQYWRDNDICEIIAPDLAKLKLQIDNYCLGTSITETTATTPGSTMNSSNSGSVTTTTSPTIGPKVQKTNFSGPDPATFAAPTPPVASPSPAVIACIATLGTVIIVLAGVIAYRYYSQRSSTNAGRNRAEPMPPPASGRPRAEGQLPTPPRDHYQPLSFRPRNKRPLPAPPRDHYQPLSFRPRNTRPLPAPRRDHYQPLSFRPRITRPLPAPRRDHCQPLSFRPRNTKPLPAPRRDHCQPLSFSPRNTRPLPAPPGHYQTLTFRQGNTATGDYNPLMGNEKEPAPSDIPVYLELIGYESTDNHGEPVADGQPGIATGSNSVANTGKPTRPGSPVYHVLTKHGTDSDDNHGEPLADGQAAMATGSNSVANTGKPTRAGSPVYHVLTKHGTDSDDNYGEPLADGQAGMATGSNSMANTGKPTRPGSPVYHVLTEHGTDSDDNHGEPVGRQQIAAAPWRTLGKR